MSTLRVIMVKAVKLEDGRIITKRADWGADPEAGCGQCAFGLSGCGIMLDREQEETHFGSDCIQGDHHYVEVKPL